MANNTMRPSEAASVNDKLSLSYGLKYAKYIHDTNYNELDARNDEWEEKYEMNPMCRAQYPEWN